MVRMVALLGIVGACALSLTAAPALGATDRILCAGDGATGAILVPSPVRAGSPHEPLIALDGAIAAAQAGSALQRWAGPRFASPRNAQVLDTFFKARTGGAVLAVTALDGYLVYQPIADATGSVEYQIANRLRVAAARDLPVRECLTLKLPLWHAAGSMSAPERAAPTRFRALMARVGDAPVAGVAEAPWIELLHVGGGRQLATTETAIESSGSGN